MTIIVMFISYTCTVVEDIKVDLVENHDQTRTLKIGTLRRTSHVSTVKCLMENSDLIATVGQAMVKIMVDTL